MLLFALRFFPLALFALRTPSFLASPLFVGFALLLMLYVLGMAAQGESGFWRDLFHYLSITTHLDGFVRGVVRLTDLVYYLSLSFIALFLTWRVIEAERWK